MRLSNRTEVPQLFFEAMEQLYNNHSKLEGSTFSATEMLKPVKQIYLKRNMKEEDLKVVDVQEAMDLIFGTVVHKGLEQMFKGREDCTSEKTLSVVAYADTELGEEEFKWIGTPDILWKDANGDYWLIDWKTSKQWSIDRQKDGTDSYWKDQGYIYAHFLEEQGMERPKGSVFLGLMKDKLTSKIDFEDPSTWPIQWVTYDLSDREYEKELMDRVKTKVGYVKDIENGCKSLPECTAEERWQSEPKWGVKKSTGVRWSYFDTPQEAREYVNGLKLKPVKGVYPTYEVREFPSEPKRCLNHCECINGCKQGQKLVADFMESVRKIEEDKKNMSNS